MQRVQPTLTRRGFLGVSAATALGGLTHAWVPRQQVPPEHRLSVISGKPRERGRLYGKRFSEPIREWLDREVYQSFAKEPARREELFRYAAACTPFIKSYSPEILDEMEGMAEGSGLKLEEHLLITLHEELYHKGALRLEGHCKAVASGPPDTADGQSYVGQTWDWMISTYGKSQMLLWQRGEGPSVLAYSYPGMWVGAGVNSSGLGLAWTSAGLGSKTGARIGIPTYVLIAQMLYQRSLADALEEAKRARQAGWFAFLLADGEGRLAQVEGSPDRQGVARGTGHMAVHNFQTRELTETPEGQPIVRNKYAEQLYKLLGAAKGKLDREGVRNILGDHECPICMHHTNWGGNVDTFIFNTTKREATICRGPGCMGTWKTFTFEGH
jgi:isopenicillin-N N-acyltransferase-like protein